MSDLNSQNDLKMSQVPLWSSAQVAGVSIQSYGSLGSDEMKTLANQVRDKAYKIIRGEIF